MDQAPFRANNRSVDIVPATVACLLQAHALGEPSDIWGRVGTGLALLPGVWGRWEPARGVQAAWGHSCFQHFPTVWSWANYTASPKLHLHLQATDRGSCDSLSTYYVPGT